MNLEAITKEFEEYVRFCQDAVASLGENPELQGVVPGVTSVMRNEMLGKGLILPNARDIDVLIAKRQELIDVKINHTKRVVDDVMRVAAKIGMKVDFRRILEVVARLHDIGRFEYATWNTAYGENYTDQESKRKHFGGKFAELLEPLAVKNHSEAGFELLMHKGKIKSLLDKPRFAKVISMAVLHHQDSVLKGEFSPTVNSLDSKILNSNVNDLLLNASTFNEAEIQIYAVLTQLIKDVDCLDILYQHLTGEYPVIRPSANFNKNIRNREGVVIETRTLAEFAKEWGFTSEEVAKFNNLTVEEAEKKDSLSLPLYDYQNKKWLIDPAKLVMPVDLKEKFFNLERIDLQEINKRKDWNPVVGMWWRLLQFLGNISFTSNLEVVKENGLLDKIYEMYPEEVRPYVKEAFDFAKEKLLSGRGNDIYTKPVLR